MAGFGFRGLEFHSSRMWQWAQVDQALNFMDKFGLNALIFHQNDIIDHLVFPQAFFSDDLMWKRWPVRMHSIYQNRHYINKVIRAAKERGIGFYLEVKEIWFVDELLELVPGLRNADGSVCPTNPFWWDFLDMKMRELLASVPDLSGVIVSPGTRESKVSMSANTCSCARCKATDPQDWYTDLLKSMHRPLAEQGKTFAVRDFSYTADQQSRILTAAKRCSPDVVVSLKNTPHDYYPTFPDNPRIGHTEGLRQWIEYDTWGQFFGMGVFPVSVVEDMQKRMHHAFTSGAEGIFLRTDWEVITDAGSFNSPNLLNVVAGAMLSRDVDIGLAEVYKAWAAHGIQGPLCNASQMRPDVVPTATDAAERLAAFMKASWQVMEKAAYVRGHLFHEDDQYPETVKKAFAMMVDIHGRDDWEPGASRLVDITDVNLEIIFAEKAEAVAEVRALRGLFDGAAIGLPPAMVAEFETMLDLYERYVRGYQLCAHAVFLTRKAEIGGGADTRRAARKAAETLRVFHREIEGRLAGTHYPHTLYWLLDTHRVLMLADDVDARLAAIAEAVPA